MGMRPKKTGVFPWWKNRNRKVSRRKEDAWLTTGWNPPGRAIRLVLLAHDVPPNGSFMHQLAWDFVICRARFEPPGRTKCRHSRLPVATGRGQGDTPYYHPDCNGGICYINNSSSRRSYELWRTGRGPRQIYYCISDPSTTVPFGTWHRSTTFRSGWQEGRHSREDVNRCVWFCQ